MIALGWAFVGLLLGGLRDPWLWTISAAAAWVFALARGTPSRRTLLAWAPFLAWLALSTLASDQPWKSALADSRWAGLALFAALLQSSDPRSLRRPWLLALCAAAALAGAAALWTGAPPRGHWTETMTGLLPPYYNYTAFVLEAAAAACAAGLLARAGPRGRERTLLALTLGFCLLCLLLARARGAWCALALVCAAAAWRSGRLSRRALLAGGCGLALLGGVLAMSGAGGWLLKLDHAASFNRPQIWRAALQSARDRPLLGWGPGNFEEGFRRHNFPSGFGLANYQFSTPLAHSGPLSVLAETGLPGLALLLWALLRPLELKRESGWEREAALAAAAAMGAHGLIDDFLQIPALAMLFVSALSLAGSPRDLEASGWPLPVLATGLAICVLGPVPQAVALRVERAATRADEPAKRLDLLLGEEGVFPAEPAVREAAARAQLALTPPGLDAALVELAQARRLDPTNGLYPELMGEIEASRRRWPESEADAHAAVALEPAYLDARSLLARALKAQGRGGEAAKESAELERRRRLAAQARPGTGYERVLLSLTLKN